MKNARVGWNKKEINTANSQYRVFNYRPQPSPDRSKFSVKKKQCEAHLISFNFAKFEFKRKV